MDQYTVVKLRGIAKELGIKPIPRIKQDLIRENHKKSTHGL